MILIHLVLSKNRNEHNFVTCEKSFFVNSTAKAQINKLEWNPGHLWNLYLFLVNFWYSHYFHFPFLLRHHQKYFFVTTAFIVVALLLSHRTIYITKLFTRLFTSCFWSCFVYEGNKAVIILSRCRCCCCCC